MVILELDPNEYYYYQYFKISHCLNGPFSSLLRISFVSLLGIKFT